MKWIDKNVRLPKEEQEILFIWMGPNTPINIDDLAFGGWYRRGKVYSWIEPRESRNFTHWMPVPSKHFTDKYKFLE